jgi:hypothetical protein
MFRIAISPMVIGLLVSSTMSGNAQSFVRGLTNPPMVQQQGFASGPVVVGPAPSTTQLNQLGPSQVIPISPFQARHPCHPPTPYRTGGPRVPGCPP